MAAAEAGPESHGKYMTDGKVDDSALSSFVRSTEGAEVGKRLWNELSEILEESSPASPATSKLGVSRQAFIVLDTFTFGGRTNAGLL